MSLRVWLPLNGNLNNQGLSDITVTNNGATVDNNGKIGKCYSFGTSSSYLTLSNDTINKCTTECSLSFWLNITSWNTSYATYFQAGLGSAPWNNYTFGVLRNYAASNLCFTISNGSSASNASYTTPNLELNTWYYLTFVYKTGHCLIYINGELYKDYTTTIVPNFSGITKTTVGACNNGSNYQTNCKINDLRIYDHALSPKEVEVLSRGLVCHYPLSGGGRGGDNLLIYSNVTETNFTALKNRGSGTWNKLSLTTKDGYDCYLYDKSLSSIAFSTGAWYSLMKANTTYTYSAWIYFTASANFNFTSLGHFQVYNNNSTASDKSHEDIVDARIYEPSTIPANKWTKIRITFTTNNLANSFFQVYPRYNIGANVGDLYFRDCKLEEGDHVTPWIPNSADTAYSAMGYDSTTEYDVSGYGYNGTKNGTLTYSSDTARYNVSTNFANSPYIQTTLPRPNGYANSYTFSWWGKYTNYSSHMMWGFANGNRLNLYMSGGNFYWNTGDGNNNPFNVSAATYGDGSWHHFAISGDGTTTKLYIDGEFKANAKTYKGVTGTSLYFNGWDSSTSYNFSGSLSDFRLYATALSAEQVAELYNTAVSVANNGTLMGYELVEV